MGSGRILTIGTVFVTVVAASETPCPDVCTCPSLYRADCCNASLTHIPRNLVGDVRFLNATGNSFTSLRKGAFSVHHIKILDLSKNRISAIENDALRELEYLVFLYLSRNEIVSLDQDAFAMNRRLEFLKLDNNMLEVPVYRPFLDIPSLKSLDISSCSIRSLPEEAFVRVPNLEELTLAHNKLQALHRKLFLHLKSLKYLYLSHNLLRTLHEDLFVMLKKLVVLDLSNNELETLHPEVLTFLESVEFLKLSGNRLKTLEFDVFAPLIRLERLYLDKNVLNVLNGRQFSELNNLAFLDISGNQLDTLQLRLICYLKNLTYLKVSDNLFACDCALWELWTWGLEKGVRILSTCDEPDFEFSVKNFESLRFNNSCNTTLCDVNLAEWQVRQLCLLTREIFLKQPMLLELEAPVNIAGDIHGQYEDLLRHFDKLGYPPQSNYLFLGDYVDRGRNSLETICLLLAYKMKYPNNFFLLRGNHECASINRVYGFYDECKRRYSVKLWKTFTDLFNCLPIAALIEGTIFCMHGGLSPQLTDLNQIRAIPRPIDVPDSGLVCDLLWGDPAEGIHGWAQNDRGVSYVFGSDVVRSFLQRHDCSLIVRAHQVVEDGYQFFADRSMLTLFSAPNYCGEFDNAGAVLGVSEDLTCWFSVLSPSHKKKIFVRYK